MNIYIFSLEKVHIDNTRSRHDDTDKAVFGLGIGKQSFQVKSLSMGDVNNGDHNVWLNLFSTAYRSHNCGRL
jgi:hypothetical protein